MTVYADVLILINLIVDYFILRLTARFLKRAVLLRNMILSAAFGALSSMYIFLPQMNVAVELLLKLAVCAIMCLFCFGYGSIKSYLRCFSVLTAVTFGYGGAMIAIWYIFKPVGMIINNSVVYFNISPIFLIVFSAIAYIVTVFVRKICEHNSIYSKKCAVEVLADGKRVELNAMVDTGNSIEDVFELSEIIIVDKSVVQNLFEEYPTGEGLKHRYRALPVDTVSGTAVLDGYRCDEAYINYEKMKRVLKKPVLAVAKSEICDGYNAIINPKILQ